LQEQSNFYCPPGKAGGLPKGNYCFNNKMYEINELWRKYNFYSKELKSAFGRTNSWNAAKVANDF